MDEAESLLLQAQRSRIQILPLYSPLRQGQRPSTSPEVDAIVQPYLSSVMVLSELAVAPLTSSLSASSTSGVHIDVGKRLKCVSGVVEFATLFLIKALSSLRLY